MRIRAAATLTVFALLAPAAPASPSAAALSGLVPPGGRAVELKGPVPRWYTPSLHARVVKAGRKGEAVPLPEGVQVPQSALLFTGIRPGSWMIFPAGCTLNFVFGGGTQIGTAGHCASPGDEVTIVAAPGVLMNIGTVRFSRDNGIGDDFALIDIYPEMQQYVNPSMAYFGGPTGSQAPAIGDTVVHVGHGVVIGTGGTPRPGVVTYTGPGDTNDPAAAYGWDGAASPGDSGSPVRHLGGPAAGNLTHLVVGSEYLPAVIAGTTITRMEELAGPVTTAPAVPDPLWGSQAGERCRPRGRSGKCKAGARAR